MGKKMKTLLVISVVIGLTIFFHYLSWLQPIENILRSLITPASKLMYTLSINTRQKEDVFASSEELKQAYKNLKEELLKNKINLADFKLLQDENAELRQQLGFLQKKSFQSIGAEVIGKNIDPLGNTIIINRGAKDGIKIGKSAIVSGGILIGKVVKTEDATAVIRLINDNQSKVAATIINKDKSLGLVEGGYGISVYLNYIPQNEMIAVNDIVVTSGLEDGIPKGLLVGPIVAVEKEAYQPFQKAVISPAADLNKILLVSIITQI